MRGTVIALAGLLWAPHQSPTLSITIVGNAGVLLSDGATSLLVDLPYESGAFGYQTYDPSDLNPPGYQVRPWDPLSLVVATGGLVSVALVACWMPARRAIAVDPAATLRSD